MSPQVEPCVLIHMDWHFHSIDSNPKVSVKQICLHIGFVLSLDQVHPGETAKDKGRIIMARLTSLTMMMMILTLSQPRQMKMELRGLLGGHT